MAAFSKMIVQFVAAVVASHLSVDGFVLPVGQVSPGKRMQRNINPLLFSTKYDGSGTKKKIDEGLHTELESDKDGDVDTSAAEQLLIKGNLSDTDSNANEAIVTQQGTADEVEVEDEQLIQDQLEDKDEIMFDAANEEDVLLQSDQQRKKNNPRMRMFTYLSQPVIEVRIIGLVLLSCFLQAINTIENIPAEVHQGINVVDTFFVYIFAIEFFLRWWSAGRFQLRYLAKPLVSIDAVVVILPLILSGFLPIWDFGVMAGFIPGVSLPGWLISTSSANSALLNLRLLRILKFQRVLTNENTYMNFEMALGMKQTDVRPYQLQLARVVISIFTLVSVSTGLIYTAEHDANPLFTDYFTALYFGLTTLTTVGFGDITPVTFQGRIVVMASILAGVIVVPAQAASL
jgi:voltage-gated potassium channel